MSARNRIEELTLAPAGERHVLLGNVAFAVGCARGGIHGADGYPGTPSTEVIHRGLRYLQKHMDVGWSVNEATATTLAFGYTMAGGDMVVTMKIPGLFQAADVVASVAGCTEQRGGLVLFVASDYTPSSTQYVFDPRYFLKSCFVPVLEPRDHQELLEVGPQAAALAREHRTPVVVLVSDIVAHSEGSVQLNPIVEVPRLDEDRDFSRFMSLPRIVRANYRRIVSERLPGLIALAEETPLNRIEWHDRSLGVVIHGATELYLREVQPRLPVRPSVLSLGMTFPLPTHKVREFADGIRGPIVVLGDGLRFVQEELASQGVEVEGKQLEDATTEWSPELVAARLGAAAFYEVAVPVSTPHPPRRPPGICPGCAHRGFALVVQKLRKRNKIVASFGDIGCNSLLYFLRAIDTCTCMGAADSKRQGAVLADPSLVGKSLSVIGDSTECHTGLASTRNAVFRGIPGVKVVLDNRTTAMTGGQPAPTSQHNLAGEETSFDLVGALEGEGARVEVVDAFQMGAMEKTLLDALERAEAGEFTVVVVRGECLLHIPAKRRQPHFRIDHEACGKCGLCYVCPGLEEDDQGYPGFTHLCTGCGGHEAICVQRCNLNAIVPVEQEPAASPTRRPKTEPRLEEEEVEVSGLPPSLRVAVRGVGGQGNLFVGRVLAEAALSAGFERVVKGETHGMAQLGGPVVSTFAAGEAHSPSFLPGTADALVALEPAELLRPGFLELAKPGATVVLNTFRLLPTGSHGADYPSLDSIRAALAGFRVLEVDMREETEAIGDDLGRTTNVVAIGLLSTVQPFARIPAGLWRRALIKLSPPHIVQRNLAAFARGRDAAAR